MAPDPSTILTHRIKPDGLEAEEGGFMGAKKHASAQEDVEIDPRYADGASPEEFAARRATRPQTLSEMIARCRFDEVDERITEELFPVEPGFYTTEDVAVAGAPTQGFVPANIEHLLARIARYPDELRKYTLCAPDVYTEIRQYKHFPAAFFENGKRTFRLVRPDKLDGGKARFVILRP